MPFIKNKLNFSLIRRLCAISFLCASVLAFNTLYIQQIGSGIGLYNGLFQVNIVTNSISFFLLLISSILLLIWPNIKERNITYPIWYLLRCAHGNLFNKFFNSTIKYQIELKIFGVVLAFVLFFLNIISGDSYIDLYKNILAVLSVFSGFTILKMVNFLGEWGDTWEPRMWEPKSKSSPSQIISEASQSESVRLPEQLNSEASPTAGLPSSPVSKEELLLRSSASNGVKAVDIVKCPSVEIAEDRIYRGGDEEVLKNFLDLSDLLDRVTTSAAESTHRKYQALSQVNDNLTETERDVLDNAANSNSKLIKILDKVDSVTKERHVQEGRFK